MSRLLLAALALAALGCKQDPPREAVTIAPVRMPKSAPVDDPPATEKAPDPPPGGSDTTEIGAHSPDRAAREWARAAKSDDILKLLRMTPALSDPATGATLDEDAQRAYYGKLLGETARWVSVEKPERVTHDRIVKWAAKNHVDRDLKRAIDKANYVMPAEGGDEPTAIFLTVYEKRGDYYISSAVEVPYKGDLP